MEFPARECAFFSQKLKINRSPQGDEAGIPTTFNSF